MVSDLTPDFRQVCAEKNLGSGANALGAQFGACESAVRSAACRSNPVAECGDDIELAAPRGPEHGEPYFTAGAEGGDKFNLQVRAKVHGLTGLPMTRDCVHPQWHQYDEWYCIQKYCEPLKSEALMDPIRTVCADAHCKKFSPNYAAWADPTKESCNKN